MDAKSLVEKLFGESEDFPARLSQALLAPRGSMVVEQGESAPGEYTVSVAYDFPEHAPKPLELQPLLAPEFSRVIRRRSDRDREVFNYTFR